MRSFFARESLEWNWIPVQNFGISTPIRRISGREGGVSVAERVASLGLMGVCQLGAFLSHVHHGNILCYRGISGYPFMANTEKTSVPFPFTLNGICSC